jgi:hypothetical protein
MTIVIFDEIMPEIRSGRIGSREGVTGALGEMTAIHADPNGKGHGMIGTALLDHDQVRTGRFWLSIVTQPEETLSHRHHGGAKGVTKLQKRIQIIVTMEKSLMSVLNVRGRGIAHSIVLFLQQSGGMLLRRLPPSTRSLVLIAGFAEGLTTLQSIIIWRISMRTTPLTRTVPYRWAEEIPPTR